MLVWTYYICLVIFMLAGWVVNLAGLPGLWLMLAGIAGYAWLTGGAFVGLWTLLILLAIVLLAEVVEFIAGGAGAKRAGASGWAIWSAVAGGVIGAIFLSFLLPIPVVGTIFGACLGSFLGAFAVEMMRRKSWQDAMRIGAGAAEGRFYGIVSKSAFGFVVLLIAMWMALPIG
jgi:uncharacterized protein